MTKSEFRKLGMKVIDSINHEMRKAKSKNFMFEEETDYDSGRLGAFYAPFSKRNITLCIQLFVNFDNTDFICTTAIFPLPDDFMQLYPELNVANDELCGVKITYNEEFHGLAMICEIDTRNAEDGNYGKLVLNGVNTVLQNIIKVLENQLLKGVFASIEDVL